MLPSGNATALKILLQWYETFCHNKICGIMGRDLKIIASNKLCGEFCNLDCTLTGLSFFDLYPRIDNRKKQELQVMFDMVVYKKQKLQFISANFHRKLEYMVAFIEYEPILNKNTDEVIAIMVSANTVPFPLRFYNIKKQLQTGKPLGNFVINQCSLVDEVAFLLFQAENYEEIAEILSLVKNYRISKSLVAKTIRTTLFEQFKVFNLKNLKGKLHSLNYHKKIPPTLLGESIFLLDNL